MSTSYEKNNDGINILQFLPFSTLLKKIMESLTYRSKLHVFTKSATLFDQKHVKEKQIGHFYHERIEMFNASLKFHTTESFSFSYFRFDYDVVNLFNFA